MFQILPWADWKSQIYKALAELSGQIEAIYWHLINFGTHEFRDLIKAFVEHKALRKTPTQPGIYQENNTDTRALEPNRYLHKGDYIYRKQFSPSAKTESTDGNIKQPRNS